MENLEGVTGCEDNSTLWLILAIVFIILFLISFGTNIFLWIVRRQNITKLREELQHQYNVQLRDSQKNVFYGGTKSTYM